MLYSVFSIGFTHSQSNIWSWPFCLIIVIAFIIFSFHCYQYGVIIGKISNIAIDLQHVKLCIHAKCAMHAGARRCFQTANQCLSVVSVCRHWYATDWHGGGDHGVCCAGLPISGKQRGADDSHAAPLRVHGHLWRLLLSPFVQNLQGTQAIAPPEACLTSPQLSCPACLSFTSRVILSVTMSKRCARALSEVSLGSISQHSLLQLSPGALVEATIHLVMISMHALSKALQLFLPQRIDSLLCHAVHTLWLCARE